MSSGETAMQKWVQKFSKVEEMASLWSGARLTAIQANLENDAKEVTLGKDALAEGRKNVAAMTKEFSKLGEEEKVQKVGKILKTYQQYIDETTKQLNRCRDLYLEANSQLKVVADPSPVLKRLLADKMSVLEMVRSSDELDRMRRKLSEREAELAELKNQEITIQQLREELAAAEYGQAEQAAVEEENEEAKSVLKQWQQREHQLQQEIARMSQECRKFQIQISESNKQLEEERSAAIEIRTTKEAEIDALHSDLENLTLQVSLVERDQARLRSSEEQATARQSELENRLLDLQEELDAKVDMIAKLEGDLRNLTTENQVLTKRLEVSAKETTIATATAMSVLEQEQREKEHKSEIERIRSSHFQELEKVRTDLLGSQTESVALRNELEFVRGQGAGWKKQVDDLEKELRQVMLSGGMASSSAGGSAGERPPSANDAANPLVSASSGAGGPSLANPSAPKFDLATVIEDIPSVKSHNQRPGGEEPSSHDALKTVETQRDRWKQRLLALEESSQKEIDALKLKVADLSQQNDQLHQYIRHGGASGSSGASQSFAIRMPGSTNSVVMNTSAIDKLASLITKFVLANESTRRIFVCYLLALHFLVFMVLAAQTFQF